MKDYNQWASELNVGAYYQKPMPKPTCHYFDTSVFKQSLNNNSKQNLSIMKLFKKLLGFLAVLILMSSCSTYINVASEGSRCKVPAPRKFERTKVFPTRSHPMYRMGVQ
jgi:hypothetical protein